jgi:pimeloyl-ACP methyl ester carboxylesterase
MRGRRPYLVTLAFGCLGRRGGQSPPVLLLHGMPQTHLMWHRVARRLAERHTVVATDLRGFRRQRHPAQGPDHAPYSMRTLARTPSRQRSAPSTSDVSG